MGKTKKNRTQIKLNDWVIDNERMIIVYATRSRGQVITGVAQCSEGDTYNVEVGKQLAYKRCQLALRQRDLLLCQQFINAQESMVALLEEEQPMVSRNFDRAILRGYTERKIQYKNINRLKKEIADLSKKGEVGLKAVN